MPLVSRLRRLEQHMARTRAPDPTAAKRESRRVWATLILDAAPIQRLIERRDADERTYTEIQLRIAESEGDWQEADRLRALLPPEPPEAPDHDDDDDVSTWPARIAAQVGEQGQRFHAAYRAARRRLGLPEPQVGYDPIEHAAVKKILDERSDRWSSRAQRAVEGANA